METVALTGDAVAAMTRAAERAVGAFTNRLRDVPASQIGSFGTR